jgi:scyllo-inositol 2-dehydrogenase (NAD+)
MINVAMLSKWHVHAGDYAKQAQNHPDLEIKVVWDEDPERGEKWAGDLGVPFVADLGAVLSDDSIDAVIVDTPTNMHKEVIIAAAQHKKHIFTEKVLAFTVSDCDEIHKAVEEAGVTLTVSLPRLTESYYLYAQKALDEGLLGKLTTVRCRLAHNGAVPSEANPNGWLPEHFFNKEQCGGGALIDLGAHPIYLTNRFAGSAASLTARLQSSGEYDVDDNSVVVVEYDSGALGVLETGFLSNGSPFQLELYGTEGTLLIEDNSIRLKSSQIEENGWVTPDDVPADLPMPLLQWVSAIKGEAKSTLLNDDTVRLTQINQAALLSQEENRSVRLNEITSKVNN